MPQQQYLSTDPTAGQAAKGGYLSTDPNAGSGFVDAAKNFVSNFGAAVDPRPALKLLYDSASGVGGVMLGDPSKTAALSADLKGIGQAQLAQFSKAKQAYDDGRYSEAVGHTVAGAMPLVGPAAANAGEQIGRGDVSGGLGSAAGLLSTVEAPRIAATVAPRVAAGVSAAGQVLDRAGLSVGDLVPPIVTRNVPPIIPKLIQAVQKYREGAPESPNAGGKLTASQEPSLNDVIGEALDALRQPAPVGTLPPQPSLPPGYSPRSTLPQVASPSGTVSLQAAAPTPASQVAPQAPATSPAAAPPTLPGAWAQFAKPASFPAKEIEGSGLAAAFDQELAKRGMAASDAIPLVKRNTALPSDVRTQLVSALEKVARKQAGVSVPSMTDPTLPAAWQALIQK